MKQRTAYLVASLAGFTGVAIGAFGAHGLEGRVSPELLATFEVGARYHMYHALAILGVAAVLPRLGRLGGTAVICFAIGVTIFAGSLYLLTLTGQRWLGAITPIGGLFLLGGWACLLVAAVKEGRPGDRAALRESS